MKNGKTDSVKCFLSSFLALSQGMCVLRSAYRRWPVIHLQPRILLEARIVSLKMITLPGVPRIWLYKYGLHLHEALVSAPLNVMKLRVPLWGPCQGPSCFGCLANTGHVSPHLQDSLHSCLLLSLCPTLMSQA